MLPRKSLPEYLDFVKQEIGRVQAGLQKPEPTRKDGSQIADLTELINRSKKYLEILRTVETQYQSEEKAPLIEDAYGQLEKYLKIYLNLLTPENKACFDGSDPKIILYVGENPAIRRFPLAKKFFIAIREQDIRQDPPVWTTLAHELGHFVYWNSQFPVEGNTEIVQTAQTNNNLFVDEIAEALGVTADEMAIFSEGGNPPPQPKDLRTAVLLAGLLSAWSEEIFADIFGVYLAGEEYFTQSKQIYFNNLADPDGQKFKNDKDHPFPLLRPYIAAKALENITGTPNNLWRSFKREISSNYQDQFLTDIKGQHGNEITDDNLVLSVAVKNGDSSDIDIRFEELKSAITTTIALLGKKIRRSIPFDRLKDILEFIEEFDNPPPPGFIAVVQQGIVYYIRLFLGG